MTVTTFTIPAENRAAMIGRVVSFLNSALPGKALRVEICQFRKRRSMDQNAALWGVALKTLSDLTGNEAEDLHTFFLGEWAGWDTVDVMGQKRRVPKRRSSKLTTAEFSEYYDFIQRRAAECGFYVPSPNEVIA